MDINIDIIRKRSAFSSRISSKESLTYLNTSSRPYNKIMEIQNDLSDKNA